MREHRPLAYDSYVDTDNRDSAYVSYLEDRVRVLQAEVKRLLKERECPQQS